jgi:hypothetical protein
MLLPRGVITSERLFKEKGRGQAPAMRTHAEQRNIKRYARFDHLNATNAALFTQRFFL